ncbi:MAG: GNAT family N-acetyltransferase [Spirochaetes bacterium]|nr:GNAT family N-acetyltransferase [Spirochaetota bacterium]MBU0954882.1 GNAT family N-acetyltransferase [Spirochaetota bacterium]
MNWLEKRTPYRIETGRLVLKCWEPRYAQRLLNQIQASAGSLLPWMPFAKPPYPDLAAEINLLRSFRGRYDSDRDYTLGVFDPTEEQVIGSTGLHLRDSSEYFEIGYWIGLEHQGRGYATETASALIKVAFEYSDTERVEINTAAGNLKSQAVIKKLGLHFEGTLRGLSRDADHNRMDQLRWSITREEYRQSAHRDTAIRVYDCLGQLLPEPAGT